MDWKEYEIYITNHFRKIFPEASIRHNVKRQGIISNTKRQIDILIEGSIAGVDLSIVVDCKYFSKKISITTVEAFLSFLRDVKASKGIMITNRGYSKNAYNRATYDSQDIELRIINFDDLESYQGFMAIPYSGQNCFLMSAPHGWIIDNTSRYSFLASLYSAGLVFEDLNRIGEGFIYIDYSKKDHKLPKLYDLLKLQESEIKNAYSAPKIELIPTIEREDCDVQMRVIDAPELGDYLDYTIFLNYKEFVFFLCAVTPRKKENDYLRKLKWIAEKLIRGTVILDAEGNLVSDKLQKRT